MNLGLIGYSVSAFAYLALAILMVTSWKGRLVGALLVTALFVNFVWSIFYAYQSYSGQDAFDPQGIVEVFRYAAWFVFVLKLLDMLRTEGIRKRATTHLLIPFLAFSVLLIALGINIYIEFLMSQDDRNLVAYVKAFSLILLSITGLILAEQVFRNTRPERKWSVKYLFLGTGTIFVFDFFLFANAILSKSFDLELWQARGYINVLAVPMLAVAASRNRQWSGEIFVSKQIVFYSTSLIGAGIYLLIMAGAGYYLRIYGGEWGTVAQAVFLAFSAILLVALFFSDTLRSRIKVYLNKHFFRNKFDYRDEWLNLTEKLSNTYDGPELQKVIIRSIADIYDSNGGMLWMREVSVGYLCTATVKVDCPDQILPLNDPLVEFMEKKGWIIDIPEYVSHPARYAGLRLPSWLLSLKKPWLIIPMFHHNRMLGFLVLNHSRIHHAINYEDRDLLNTACLQAASYLALLQANEALKQGDQFAVFNRLSAYVVHDLKNLVAQLGLVVRNSEKFRHNPDFVDDALETVRNATQKMERLLSQLRKDRFEKQDTSFILIPEALEKIVGEYQVFLPRPELLAELEPVRILANRDRFDAVIGHIIRNAQEATKKDGYVRVEAERIDGEICIRVVDNGCGMDLRFIREKLFAPFETTKGNAGMGVGVYESREFIHSIGGRFEVISASGKGTTITIVLPVQKDDTNENTEQEVGESS